SGNRLTQLKAPSPLAGEGGGERGFGFTYDSLGRRTKLTYPNGVTTNYTYDSSGYLTNLLTQYAELQNHGKKRPPILKLHTLNSFTYTHDKVGNRLTKTDTHTDTKYTYDTIYRLLQSTPVKVHNDKEKEFEHRLVPESFYQGAETFTYDPAGNRLTGPKEKLAYSYNVANQLTELAKVPLNKGKQPPLIPPLLRGIEGVVQDEGESPDSVVRSFSFAEEKKTEYTYDNNGNLIKKFEFDEDGNIKRTTFYTYDFENRLTKVEVQKNRPTLSPLMEPALSEAEGKEGIGGGLKIVTFTYDPFGRRLSKAVHMEEIDEEDDGVDNDKDEDHHHTPRATYYIYDNEDIIMEYNHRGKITARYVHGLGIDEPLAIERLAPERLNQGKGKVYYYHFDGLGSVTALTDSKGKMVQRYEYDSFGKLKRHGNKIKNAYTYTSREYDRETGLYYFRARYYDAKVGRFISFDHILRGFSHTEATTCRKSINSFPLLQPQKLHPYIYTGNAPINWVDPWGECPATIDTGWIYTTEGPNRATDYRYQSQYRERTLGTLIKQSGKCENRCGGIIDCTYIFAEGYYARKRDYDRGTRTYGNWDGWRGYEN
ncbi:MAG: RHS repeat-associated core domain-containing protein, partial [Nitrospinota bacterium]